MRDVILWAAVVLVAVLALAAVAPVVPSSVFLEWSFLLCLVNAGAVVDARHRVIPDAVWVGIVVLHGAFLGAGAALGLAAPTAAGPTFTAPATPLLVESLFGAVALGGGLLAFTLAYEALSHAPQALGGGDVKLVFALGFALGLGRGMLALAVACAVFALYAGVLALHDRIHGLPTQRTRAFGPALAAGTCLVLLAC
jgi:prepilin signal peptidase PulO-like enzyme (type II secretory pathway)